MNGLAFSHKIYSLSDDFLKLLNKLSEAIKENLDIRNYKSLISILLIELIQNRKLDLTNSRHKTLIKESIDSLKKGDYENLDFLVFLKRFNYSFIDFNVNNEIESLFEKLNKTILSLSKKTNDEKQLYLQHFLHTYDKYFELLLFYQELSSEKQAKEYFIRFIKIIDELRTCFSSILWFDEFSNFTLIKGEISSVTKAGLEVKIDEENFNRNILAKNLEVKLSKDFVSHFGYGFLHISTMVSFPKARALFNTIEQKLSISKQLKIEISPTQKEQIEEINKFYISKLNYSASNRKNVLALTPFRDSINKIVTKYELKAFFSSVELFLIEKANSYLSIPSPFISKKYNWFKLIIPQNYIEKYKVRFSEEAFWHILKDFRPFLYETIYLRHHETQESIKKITIAFNNNEIVKGFIKSRVKGGMTVDLFGVEAFLPGSQIDIKPILNYDDYVGKTLEFKIVKINQEFTNFIVSHKALLELEFETQKQDVIPKFEIGQILVGTVKNIVAWGVFVELDGIDGMIHKSDLSWDLVVNPEDFVKKNDVIKVIVLDFDIYKKRVALGLKQLSPHP